MRSLLPSLCAALFVAALGASLAHASTAGDWRILDPAASLASPGVDSAGGTAPAAGQGGERVPPFILAGEPPDRERAEDCLTAAIYYEAANEPLAGQEAVAQVVLNRVRHPLYPKSVCGVVYEGAGAGLGCQFTFACDGSLARHRVSRLWDGARAVAQAALAGHVAAAVGSSTHYHAYYVSPAWRTALVRIERIGAHIFYRLPGPRGSAAALTGRYAGFEPLRPAIRLAGNAGDASVGARGRRGPNGDGGPRSVDFTVWGLKMATISVERGRIDVKSGS